MSAFNDCFWDYICIVAFCVAFSLWCFGTVCDWFLIFNHVCIAIQCYIERKDF